MSDDEWNFKTKDDMIYIENISKTKVLGTSKILPTLQGFDSNFDYDNNDNLVILQDFEEDKAEQLWKKGEPNAEGYFTLENFKVSKFMTATSSTSLELKGNMNKVDNA